MFAPIFLLASARWAVAIAVCTKPRSAFALQGMLTKSSAGALGGAVGGGGSGAAGVYNDVFFVGGAAAG